MSEWKEKKVSWLTEDIKKSKIIGVLTVRNLPSKQLQEIRTKLPAKIVMSKKNLLLRALKGSKKKGASELEKYITDQPALILSDENPFRLCAIINKSRSPAPAKGGDIAPNDIVIEKGATPFQPGPVLGELKGVGIPCSIDGGKIVITETKTILKAGEEISPKLAEMLGRLDIEPMEIGLELLACYEKGSIFTKDVLSIDEDEYFNNFVKAYQSSMNLSVEAAFPTPINVELLILKCYSNSKGLSIEAGVLNSATVGDILGKAARSASAIASKVDMEAPAAKPAEPEPAESKSAEGESSEPQSSETESPESKSPSEGEKQEAGAAAPTKAPSGESQEEPKAEEPKPEAAKTEEPKADEKSEEPQEAKED